MTTADLRAPRASNDPGLVIVGASHCGVQSAFAARRAGYTGSITLLGDEARLPYHRPPLSKDVLVRSRALDQIALRPQRAYARSDIELRTGRCVVRIDRRRRFVETACGEAIRYDRLLLATGARPRLLDVPGASLTGVHYLRNADDVAGLHEIHDRPRNCVVVGGGYIGLEAASSLRKLGAQVTIIESMERVLQRVASPALSSFYMRLHTEEGVTLITDAVVDGFEGNDRVVAVSLGEGRRVEADLVVVGIGVIPNTELAEDAGLPVDDGILVDEFARTCDPRVYAAGDCARGLNELYGHPLRVESVQNASDQGRCAVNHIAGVGEPFRALPWFWSDQYDVKLQIAGLLGDADRLVVRGNPTEGRSFALCHLRGDVLIAVEAVNTPADFLGAKSPIVARARMDIERLCEPQNPIVDCVIESVS